ncbi:hypothetical protein MKX01_027536 [Papaver californicum]|nr:hypothetical protein MKX01_027536 [Papaver californicum]
MKMNFFSFIFILIIQFSSFFSVNSQSDSCTSNSLNLKGLPFNTTSLSCFPLWSTHDYVLRYSKTGSDVWNFLLSAPSGNNYIAMGFSQSGKMIGSSAVVGWIGTDSTGIAKQYFLGAKRPNAVIPDQGNLTFVDKSSPMISSQNSRLYLAFQLKTEQPLTNVIYSIGPDGFVPDSRFQLTQHVDQGNTLVSYQTGQDKAPGPPSGDQAKDPGAPSGQAKISSHLTMKKVILRGEVKYNFRRILVAVNIRILQHNFNKLINN